MFENYNVILDKYPFTLDLNQMESDLFSITQSIEKYKDDVGILKKIFNCIDLTSLNTEDSSESIRDFVEKVNRFEDIFPGMPQVAALCVYPVFAAALKAGLKNASIKRAVVSAGFPSAQTFTDVKVMETKRAVQMGAHEVDVVISVGEFMEGNYEFVGEEIVAVKQVMGEAHLKVILETGALHDPKEIWMASLLAMEAGADFIKTSTGKQQPAATLEAAYVMCRAIKVFNEKNNRKVGFKPAGGISTTMGALAYYGVVESILGEEWLSNEWFRIGASRLANALLTDINYAETGIEKEVKYF